MQTQQKRFVVGLAMLAMASFLGLAFLLSSREATKSDRTDRLGSVQQPPSRVDGVAADRSTTSSQPFSGKPAGHSRTKLSGTVLERLTRVPIATAEVSIASARSRTTSARSRSGELGEFYFADIPRAEEFTVIATRPGYVPYVRHRAATELTDDPLTIELDRGPRVVGSITLTDGSRLSGVSVVLSRLAWSDGFDKTKVLEALRDFLPRERYKTTSDGEGRFSIENIPLATYSVHFYKLGLMPATSQDGVLQKKRLVHVLSGTTELALVMDRPAFLACRAVDDSGRSIDGARAIAWPYCCVPTSLDSDESRSLLDTETRREFRSTNTFLAMLNTREAVRPLRIFFSALGYEDGVCVVTPLVLPENTTLPARVIPSELVLARSPLRQTCRVEIKVQGPPWIGQLTSIGLCFMERSSPINRSPRSSLSVSPIVLREGVGHADVPAGIYNVSGDEYCNWLETLSHVDITPGTVLSFDLQPRAVPVAIAASSPDGDPIPIEAVIVGRRRDDPRNPGHLVVGRSSPGEGEFVVRTVIPFVGDDVYFDVRPSAGPCRALRAEHNTLSWSTERFNAINVTLPWCW